MSNERCIEVLELWRQWNVDLISYLQMEVRYFLFFGGTGAWRQWTMTTHRLEMVNLAADDDDDCNDAIAKIP